MKAESKGRALLFLLCKKKKTPPIGAFDALKIIKNGIKLRKLWSPQSRGG
jgi:hypothetical protein